MEIREAGSKASQGGAVSSSRSCRRASNVFNGLHTLTLGALAAIVHNIPSIPPSIPTSTRYYM